MSLISDFSKVMRRNFSNHFITAVRIEPEILPFVFVSRHENFGIGPSGVAKIENFECEKLTWYEAHKAYGGFVVNKAEQIRVPKESPHYHSYQEGHVHKIWRGVKRHGITFEDGKTIVSRAEAQLFIKEMDDMIRGSVHHGRRVTIISDPRTVLDGFGRNVVSGTPVFAIR